MLAQASTSAGWRAPKARLASPASSRLAVPPAPNRSDPQAKSCACGGECPRCRSKRPLQAKLAVGTAGDAYEREADRVAERATAAPVHASKRSSPQRVQRFTGQRSGQAGEAPASVEQVLARPGRPIEPGLRQDMEERLGHDFSHVRIHTDTAAAQSASELSAHAYTVGPNIVFGQDHYSPTTQDGRRLIAHELTHVLQQADGSPRVQRYGAFVPCEQPSLSIQPCPPREPGEVAESKTDPMTVHGTQWLSENGYPVNGFLVAGFEVGGSAIKKSLGDRAEWKQLVAFMRGSNVRWKIQGLSDCSGPRSLNQGIRRARARAVYNALPPDARKNVVSTEPVSLYECMTGNQRKVDRAVNRSVLIEQVGRTVDIKPKEEEVIEPNLPKFVCGPDVTQQVAEAVALSKTIFSGWNRSQRIDACDALISMEGLMESKPQGGSRTEYVAGCSWDIYELHNNDWINKDYRPACATVGAKPPCGESVQIDSDCHHAGAVNYVIFGVMFRLCSDNVSDAFVFDFSMSNMKALVDMRKGSGKSGLATPVPNFKGSLAWAKAGYEGWPAVASPSGDWNHCAPMCPLPYTGPGAPAPNTKPPRPDRFDIHWHPHRSRYTCP